MKTLKTVLIINPYTQKQSIGFNVADGGGVIPVSDIVNDAVFTEIEEKEKPYSCVYHKCCWNLNNSLCGLVCVCQVRNK